MSHAAYQRGTQVIRRQADQQIDDARPGIDARHERETARETIDALRQQIETMRAEHAAQLALVESRWEMASELLRLATNDLTHIKEKYRLTRTAYTDAAHRMNKLNAIAVTFRTMHPEQYADIRQHAEELYPQTFKPK